MCVVIRMMLFSSRRKHIWMILTLLWTCKLYYGKKRLKWTSMWMMIEIPFFFHVVIKMRFNASVIHRLDQVDLILKISKHIKDYILDFYNSLYALDTSNFGSIDIRTNLILLAFLSWLMIMMMLTWIHKMHLKRKN